MIIFNFIKDNSWFIGLIGGILGIVSFKFNYRNYTEKYVKEKNREIFHKHINLTYQECFDANALYPSEKHNIQKIWELANLISNHDIGFKGLHMKILYCRLRIICLFLKKDFGNRMFFAGFGANPKTLTEFYNKYPLKIEKLRKRYLTFYEKIVDYRISK